MVKLYHYQDYILHVSYILFLAEELKIQHHKLVIEIIKKSYIKSEYNEEIIRILNIFRK